MTAPRTAGSRPFGDRRPRERPAETALSAAPPASAPVIVLASPYAGVDRLRSLLQDHQDLACTAGTGLLPLCDQALTTWRSADGRPAGTPSALAVTATRALATNLIISILAREGKPRWCEVAIPNREAAEAFLRLFPGTRFLCLYRACPDVVRAALDASAWGITDPAVAPFTSRHPGSTVAALTAYWLAITAPLLALERDHPQSCLRVRFEDLSQDRQAGERISSFLGLSDAPGRPFLRGYHDPPTTTPGAGHTTSLPVSLIPPSLLAQANDLLRQLEYAPMVASQE
jgi:hypothetical protein